MKKVLFDTNVILDILIRREKLYYSSALSLTIIENKQADGFICETAIPLIFYLVEKDRGRQKAEKVIYDLLKILHIANVDENTIKMSLHSGFKDFEDAIIYFSALNNNIDLIITRNKKDFIKSGLPVLSPEEFLSRFMK